MSMHGSVLMIQGDHLQSLPDVFSHFGYQQAHPAERSQGWESTIDAIEWRPGKGKPRNIVHKAACVLNGWTVILDPEMVMIVNQAACIAVSEALNTKLFGMLCEGTSGTYAYLVCDGARKRWFFWQDGQILEDVGERLREEPPPDDIDEVTVLEMMTRMGVDYMDLEKVADFYVYEFDVSGFDSNPEPPAPVVKTAEQKKPRWRFS